MLPNNVCNNCIWFVEETNKVGDYSHKEAKKKGKGFCLVQSLFTDVQPYDAACPDFQEDE